MPIQGEPVPVSRDQMVIGTTPGAQFLGQDFDGDGIANIGPVGIGRWFLDLRRDQGEIENEMLQINLGFTADPNDSQIEGVSAMAQLITMQRLARCGLANLQQAIMVNPFDPTGSSCLDPSNGCAPYNLFGYGRSSQEALTSSAPMYIARTNQSSPLRVWCSVGIPVTFYYAGRCWSRRRCSGYRISGAEQVLMTRMSALLMARCDSTHGATTPP